MNTKAQKANSPQGTDVAKLVLAGIVLVAGIVAYYWFGNEPKPMRIAMVVGGVVVAAAIAWFSRFGTLARHFLTETRFEMRKVVWPTRDETVKTTAVVIAVVILLALLLGLIDLILKSVILDWLLSVN